MLSVKEVAKRFNVSPHTVRNWSNRGLIKPDQVTPTGREFFSEEQIDRLVKENKKNV